jgi:hydroxymethylbilane synthase
VRLTIAARQSHLARHQAYEVAEALQRQHPHLKIEFHFRESLGDKHLQDPLWKMPERGVFTEDFVEGLQQGEFDLVVHSWKDLPVETRPGLELIACLPRADQRDLLLVKKSSLSKDFSKQKTIIYSSSPRRMYNISELLPQIWPRPLRHLEFQSVRGNIPTRIRKMLEAAEVDGLVLAKAALDRLMSPRAGAEWEELRTQLRTYLSQCEWMILPLIENPTAAAQGAIVVEARKDRNDLKQLLEDVHCSMTFAAVQRERQTLQEFGGGCHLALGISVLPVATSPHAVKSSSSGSLSSEPLPLEPLALEPLTMVPLMIVKGQTPEGLPLWQIRTAYSGPHFRRDKVVVVQDKPSHRVPLTADFSDLARASGLFVTRAEAWPETYKAQSQQVIWTAGLNTWKKLAAKGVWVHGTVESLGFAIPDLPFLEAGNPAQPTAAPFLRLTHQRAVRTPTDRATYQIEDTDLPSLSNSCDLFYWTSGQLAELSFAANPWLKEKYHACGFGDTSKSLKALLGDKAENKLFLFLNPDECIRNVTDDKL